MIQEAIDYYTSISSNEVLDAKKESDGRVRLSVYNRKADHNGHVWIAFSGTHIALQTEIGTHSMRERETQNLR